MSTMTLPALAAAHPPVDGAPKDLKTQEAFIGALVRRMAVLENFVRQEKEQVLERARGKLEAQPITMLEQRRFMLFAQRARERELQLQAEVAEAREALSEPLRVDASMEEARLLAERTAEREKRRLQQSRQQLALCYRDGRRRDALYSIMQKHSLDEVAVLRQELGETQRREQESRLRAEQAEKEVSRQIHLSKMVELDREQESIWDVKLKLKDKEEQLRKLAHAGTRLMVLLAPDVAGAKADGKKPLFATQHERVNMLIDKCTHMALEVRRREVVEHNRDYSELQAHCDASQRAHENEVRRLRDESAAQLREETDKLQALLEDQALRAEQASVARIAEIKELKQVVGDLGSQLAATRNALARTSDELLNQRKTGSRLVQYINDRRTLLSAEPQRFTPQEIADYARYLNFDMTTDHHLLWVAEEALHAPLPPHWSSHRDENDDIYFFCQKLNKSTYSHPMDEYYRELYHELSALQHAAAQLEPRGGGGGATLAIGDAVLAIEA